MIKRYNIVILCVIILVVTALSLCLSKPATSAGAILYNKTETSRVVLKTNVNEIIQSLDHKNAVYNTFSGEDSDYRNIYAKQMLSYMNRTVLPCDDFYEYACGNWKNVIKERRSINKRNNILDNVYKLQEIVEHLLQRSHINNVAPEYTAEFELAKKIYSSCLKAKLLPVQASEVYLTVLREIGGFPALDSEWNSRNFHWLNMSAHLSNYGIRSFVNEDILPEYPFPPYFRTPDFGFDIKLHDDTIGNSSSNAYKENEKRIHDILAIYGVKESQIKNITFEIFEFLRKILKVLKRFNEDENECNIFTEFMEESNVTAIKTKWHTYYDIAWSGKTFENITQDFEDCCTPCFYLYEKIDQICEANKMAAANYLALKFLFHVDARLKDKKFQNDFCISSVKSAMIHFFDHLYMKLYFNDELRDEIYKIIKEIRQSLRRILNDANWLDDTTRKAALLKESTIIEHIGRYEDPALTKILIGELKKLQFINGTYEKNHLNLRKFKQYMDRFNGLNYEKLSNTTKPLELLVGMQPNSFYYNLDNSIYVMAGSLMSPIYNRDWPNSLKFGTLGFVIGHEFTHGFDTVGAKYDETGHEKYWWSNKSAQVFEERSNCYVDHYQNYLIPEIKRHVNGILTKNENIADGGGLREALTAFRHYLKKKTIDANSISEREENMPGIDLLPEQLFFLGFAQLWCASYKEAHYWEELTNVHVIDKYRVLGALSNNDDFAKAYSCPVGSNMNPSADKCKVW